MFFRVFPQKGLGFICFMAAKPLREDSLLVTTNLTSVPVPVDIYLLKGNNRNTRTRCEICSKLTIKTPERCHWRRSGVSVANSEHISNLISVFLLLTLNMLLSAGVLIWSTSEVERLSQQHNILVQFFIYSSVLPKTETFTYSRNLVFRVSYLAFQISGVILHVIWKPDL